MLRREDGVWTGSEEGLLVDFLDRLAQAGGDPGRRQELWLDIGAWEMAAETAARAALPEPVVIDTNFADAWVEGRVYSTIADAQSSA